jgi:hypothetical protein
MNPRYAIKGRGGGGGGSGGVIEDEAQLYPGYLALLYGDISTLFIHLFKPDFF